MVLLRRPHSEANGKQNNSGYYEDIFLQNIEVLTEYRKELEKFKHFTFHASTKVPLGLTQHKKRPWMHYFGIHRANRRIKRANTFKHHRKNIPLRHGFQRIQQIFKKGTCSISSKGRNTQGTCLMPRIFLHWMHSQNLPGTSAIAYPEKPMYFTFPLRKD